MDFERLDPQKQSWRVHGVRFVEKRVIAEWVTKMNQNESQNGPQKYLNSRQSGPRMAKGRLRHRLGSILRGTKNESFFEGSLGR